MDRDAWVGVLEIGQEAALLGVQGLVVLLSELADVVARPDPFSSPTSFSDIFL